MLIALAVWVYGRWTAPGASAGRVRFGVIGGVIVHGFAGLFVGPVVLAVVWELGRAWISDELDDPSDTVL